jgi:hypothetical protein
MIGNVLKKCGIRLQQDFDDDPALGALPFSVALGPRGFR